MTEWAPAVYAALFLMHNSFVDALQGGRRQMISFHMKQVPIWLFITVIYLWTCITSVNQPTTTVLGCPLFLLSPKIILLFRNKTHTFQNNMLPTVYLDTWGIKGFVASIPFFLWKRGRATTSLQILKALLLLFSKLWNFFSRLYFHNFS